MISRLSLTAVYEASGLPSVSCSLFVDHRKLVSLMASLIVHLIVGLLFWPFAVPFGALLGLLYSFYPISLINAFLRFGGYIALPGFTNGKVTVRGVEISYMDRNPNSKKKSPPPPDSQTHTNANSNGSTASSSFNGNGHTNTHPSPTTIVFIHGLTSQKLSWVPVIRCLPKSWRVIAIDLPGHGKSGFSDELNYSVVSMGELLHDVFITLKLKDFHLVGESIGAIYAGQYTYAHPELLSSTTLLCPPGGHRMEGGQITPAMETLENFGKGLTKKNPLFPETAQEFRTMLELVLYDPSQFKCHNKMLEALVYVQAKHYPNISKVLCDVVNGGETEEIIKARLIQNKVPGMLICGREDQICDVAGAKAAKKLCPSSKVYILNNCGHCISMEKPSKAASLIVQFINGLN